MKFHRRGRPKVEHLLGGVCARWVAGVSSFGPKLLGSQMVKMTLRGVHDLESSS